MNAQQQLQQNSRLVYLDIAKGVGLFFVMMAHSCGFPFRLDNILTAYYMPMFFLISGYTYKAGRSYIQNVSRRWTHLMKPYFIYSFLLIPFGILLRTICNWRELLQSILGIFYSRFYVVADTTAVDRIPLMQIGNSPMWFITALMCSSLLFYLIAERCLTKRSWFIGSIAVLLLISCVLRRLPVLLPWSLDTACFGTIFMLTGAKLRQHQFFERKDLFVFVTIACAVVVYGYLVKINTGINLSLREYGNLGDWSVLLYAVIGLTGSVICIMICQGLQYIPILGAGLAMMGQHTYILLAMHVTLFQFVNIGSSMFLNVTKENPALYWGYGIGKILLTAALLIAVENIVVKRWRTK